EEQELRFFVSALERALDEAAQTNYAGDPLEPHRLNRKEYANAVRDLLALEIDAAAFLPDDDKLDGFDNMATGLQVSPAFVEQYVIAARQVALQAVGRSDARAGSQTYYAAPGT